MKQKFFALILLSSVFAISLKCVGSTLYVTEDASGLGQGQKIYTLSPVNASATFVGSPYVQSGLLTDLAYDSTHDVLYATTANNNSLYAINRTTGAATLVGALGASIDGLAFDSVSGNLYGSSSANHGFYQISSSSGHATFIGSIGLFYPDFTEAVDGLAFDPVTHILYGCITGSSYLGGLVTINTITGAGTFLGATQPLCDIAFQPETGLLFGIDNGVGTTPDALYQINLSTRAATFVGQTGLFNNLGLEFAPVPEPTTFALMMLALTGLYLARRDRRPNA
jgi:hypothetical protein